MPPLVTLRLSPPSVTIGQLRLADQWAELYALLALQRREDPTAVVGVERVHRLEGWKLKKLGSVGKEIARHLAALQDAGLSQVVVSTSKTKAWRFGDGVDIDLQPDAAAVFDWLETRMMAESRHAAWGQELSRLVGVVVLLRNGRAGDAREALGSAPAELRDRSLLAWRALLEGRVAYLDEDDEHLDELDALIDAWAKSTDPAGRAVESRLRSFRVMRERFGDASQTRATLTKMAADLELGGDAGSLGVILNVLGVLERRSGNPARAFEHLCRAAGLLAVVGDYQTLQAALYNAALVHTSLLKRDNLPPDDLSFSLLDLCLSICRELHVGGDSALAEITRADWSIDRGRLDDADALLSQASRILESAEASYDQAYFMEVRARLAFERRAPMREVTRDMKAAARMFGEVGDARAEERVVTLLRRWTRERPT